MEVFIIRQLVGNCRAVKGGILVAVTGSERSLIINGLEGNYEKC